MFRFNKSLLPLANLSLLVIALAVLLSPAGSASTEKEKEPRKFYLTQTDHDGSQALSACASGYHMASLWEIFDTSSLRYNTELGFTQADSGSGPPAGSPGGFGWVRTGNVASTTTGAGQSNCAAWTSADALHFGSGVNLFPNWAQDGRSISPWAGGSPACNVTLRVWCVQD